MVEERNCCAKLMKKFVLLPKLVVGGAFFSIFGKWAYGDGRGIGGVGHGGSCGLRPVSHGGSRRCVSRCLAHGYCCNALAVRAQNSKAACQNIAFDMPPLLLYHLLRDVANQKNLVSSPRMSLRRLLAKREAPIRKYSLVSHSLPSTSLMMV